MASLLFIPDGLPPSTIGMLAVILGLSAVMSGLSGFGFSAIGAISLWLLPPPLAVPLLMALSTANQLMSLRQLKADMKPLGEWWPHGPAPYLLGGLIGVPIGLEILHALPAPILMVILGSFLVSYALYSSFKPDNVRVTCGCGWPLSVLVGSAGGIIGGFTAFPGAALVVWSGLRRLPRNEARAIVQPYILGLQIVSFAMMAVQRPQTFGPAFWVLLALMLPVVLPCTLLGVRIYQSLSDPGFHRVAFMLLGTSGAGILVKGLAGTPVIRAVTAAALR